MIASATALNLISRRIGRLYNAEELGGKPVVSFTMTDRDAASLSRP